MKRYPLTGVVLGWMLAMAMPAHAIVLRYEPKVGASHRHTAEMAGRMETSMEGLGHTMRFETRVEMQYAETVLSSDDKSTRIETKLLGGNAEVAMGGAKQSIAMPKGTMVADIDRRGRLVKLVETDLAGTPEVSQFLGPGTDSLVGSSQFGVFPEGDVKPGDTWSDTMTLPASPGQPEIRMTFNSELLELVTFQGRKCAKIRTRFSGPFTMDLSETDAGAEGVVNATLTGDVVFHYDYENAVYPYAEGSIGMAMRMTVPEAGAGAMTSNMAMNLKVKLVE